MLKKMSFMLSVTNKPYTLSVVMLCVKAPAETGNRYVLISADSDKNSISDINSISDKNSISNNFREKNVKVSFWSLNKRDFDRWNDRSCQIEQNFWFRLNRNNKKFTFFFVADATDRPTTLSIMPYRLKILTLIRNNFNWKLEIQASTKKAQIEILSRSSDWTTFLISSKLEQQKIHFFLRRWCHWQPHDTHHNATQLKDTQSNAK